MTVFMGAVSLLIRNADCNNIYIRGENLYNGPGSYLGQGSRPVGDGRKIIVKKEMYIPAVGLEPTFGSGVGQRETLCDTWHSSEMPCNCV